MPQDMPSQPINASPTGLTPRVSIGMPVYNEIKYIRKALDSLLAQTFTDFELIISDNASTDGTGSICEEFAQSDGRIRYIRQPVNLGPAANFNFVLHEAQADYFMWAGGNDRWAEDFLGKMVTILESDKNLALAFSNVRVVNATTKESRIQYIDSSVGEGKTSRLFSRMINPCAYLIYGLFRKKLFNNYQVEGYDAFDIYFTYLISIMGKIVIYPEVKFYSLDKDEIRYTLRVEGGKQSMSTFFWRTNELINKHFKGIYNISFKIILLRYCIIMTKLIRKSYKKILPAKKTSCGMVN